MLSFADYNNKTNLARGGKYHDIFKQQGKQINKKQQDIKDCVIKNNSEIFTNIPREQKTKKKKSSYTKLLEEGFKSAFNDALDKNNPRLDKTNESSDTLFDNTTNTPPSNSFIANYINNTSDEIQKTKDMLNSSLENTDSLQNTYNTSLTNYEITTNKLLGNTNNYLDNSKSNTFKNIYVNRVFSGKEATKKGAYNDNPNAPSMTILNGDYNYNTCNDTAYLLGKQYFALQQYNENTGMAKCAVSSEDYSYAKYGTYQPKCIQSNDAKMYGTGWANAIYSLNSNDNTYNYIGCYKDYSSRAMGTTGTIGGIFQNVYIAGKFGVSGWGSSDYIDPEAYWIWNTPNAASDAAINLSNNIGTPILFLGIYNYNCNGNPENCNMANVKIFGMCDDYCKIWVNNSNVDLNNNDMAIGGGWGGNGNTGYNVTFHPGTNYIEVQAYNTGGPAGLLLSFVDSNTNEILFHTDGSWVCSTKVDRYTQPYTQSFSVDTCRDYAKSAGYNFFGLQNILNNTPGTAQCMVSNDLNKSEKYGSTGGIIDKDGKQYGVDNVNVVYQMNETGNPNVMGSLGYVNEQNTISQYPSSMVVPGETYDRIQGYDSPNNDITTINNTDINNCMTNCNTNNNCGGFVYDNNNRTCWTKTTNMYGPKNISGVLVSDSRYDLYMREPKLNNNESCPTSINEITSVEWNAMEQSGSEMTLDTKCQLAAANNIVLKQRDDSENTLSGLYNTITNKVTDLMSVNTSMNKQMDVDKDIMNTNLSLYDMINKKFIKALNNGSGNINNILTNSQISVLQSNYAYMLWIILALLAIIFFVYVIRRITITPKPEV